MRPNTNRPPCNAAVTSLSRRCACRPGLLRNIQSAPTTAAHPAALPEPIRRSGTGERTAPLRNATRRASLAYRCPEDSRSTNRPTRQASALPKRRPQYAARHSSRPSEPQRPSYSQPLRPRRRARRNPSPRSDLPLSVCATSCEHARVGNRFVAFGPARAVEHVDLLPAVLAAIFVVPAVGI